MSVLSGYFLRVKLTKHYLYSEFHPFKQYWLRDFHYADPTFPVGEPFSSYSRVSQEELILKPFYLKTYLRTNSKSILEEVIANLKDSVQYLIRHLWSATLRSVAFTRMMGLLLLMERESPGERFRETVTGSRQQHLEGLSWIAICLQLSHYPIWRLCNLTISTQSF
jgi:hypothetical protein